MVDILIVGGGGREAALEWKLAQSPDVSKVFSSPGNGGSANRLPYSVDDFTMLRRFAIENHAFTVVGPETPLVNGIFESFMEIGLDLFGPSKRAAMLESSKIHAKEFMMRHEIPTAKFESFDDYDSAREYAERFEGNVVVKADGLAAGKGVTVCYNVEGALSALKDLMVAKKLGAAGNSIVIEERLVGREVSYFYLSDGSHIKSLSTAQDHKRIFNRDQGPNTGGMGSYSPATKITPELDKAIQRIAKKTVSGMATEGAPFKGILYLGLLINEGRPYVLEYNVRLGDPEAQVVLPRMISDLYPYLRACLEGRISEMEDVEWDPRRAVCIVMASNGYPGNFETGHQISGLENTSRLRDVQVFQAATTRKDGKLVGSGGRVLGVTSLDQHLERSIEKAYAAVRMISWKGEYHRTDIGQRALGD